MSDFLPHFCAFILCSCSEKPNYYKFGKSELLFYCRYGIVHTFTLSHIFVGSAITLATLNISITDCGITKSVVFVVLSPCVILLG